MIKNVFVHDNFLLQNKYAQELYQKYSADQPIIDYHNHLPPKEIAEDRKFDNITQVWLAGDHYKWRAMRTLGVD
ncbi:glucuronate isomerase, partial [Autumnicola musiva]